VKTTLLNFPLSPEMYSWLSYSKLLKICRTRFLFEAARMVSIRDVQPRRPSIKIYAAVHM